MTANFIQTYINSQYYLQNAPINRTNFIEHCQRLGLMNQLVIPGKDRPVQAHPLLEFGGSNIDLVFRSTIYDDIYDVRPKLNEQRIKRLITSPLFDNEIPSGKKTVEYYSSFQFLHIDKFENGIYFDDKDIHNLLKLTITTQNIYMPFFRSSGKHIQFHGEDKNWLKRRESFNLEKYLKSENLEIRDVLRWYQKLPDLAKPLLGIARNSGDWIELWKNISWSKKENLEGNVRRGVEYLQWAIMLKAILRDYKNAEVLDIDEVDNIVYDQILDYEPNAMNQRHLLLRANRNHLYTDPDTGHNYYHDKYRRLNYLANSFGLEYQPKLILFIEGEIEEKQLPRIVDWYCGGLGSLGIEMINLQGVDTFQSTHTEALKLKNLLTEIEKIQRTQILSKNKRRSLNQVIGRLNDVDIILTNWESFINFNLQKWQSIPYFLTDNEGRLPQLLQMSKIIKFGDNRYDVPNQWKYIWGKTNSNLPLRGDSFELANFTNQEICKAIEQVYGDAIEEDSIENLRMENESLERIIETLKKANPLKVYRKSKIVDKMVTNMLLYYQQNDSLPLDRPIFDVVNRIRRIASLNHAPTNTLRENDNRKAIIEQMEDNIKF